MPTPVAKFIFRRWGAKGYETEEQQITLIDTPSGTHASFISEKLTSPNRGPAEPPKWIPTADDLAGVKIFDGQKVLLELPAVEAVVSWFTYHQSIPNQDPPPTYPQGKTDLHHRRVNVDAGAPLVFKLPDPNHPTERFTPQTTAVPMPIWQAPFQQNVFAAGIGIWLRVPCAFGDLNLRQHDSKAPQKEYKAGAWVVIYLNAFKNRRLVLDRIRLVAGDYAVQPPTNQEFGCWLGTTAGFDLQTPAQSAGNETRPQDFAVVSPHTAPTAPASLMERVFGLHASSALVAPGAKGGIMRAFWTRSGNAGQRTPWRLTLWRAYNCAEGLEDTLFRGEETLLMAQQATALDRPLVSGNPAGMPILTQGDESSWEISIAQVLGRGNRWPHTFDLGPNVAADERREREKAAKNMGARCWKALMETWRHRLDRERDLLFYLTPLLERTGLSLLPRFDCKAKAGGVTLHPKAPQPLAAGERLDWGIEFVGLRDNLGASVKAYIEVQSAIQPGRAAKDTGAKQWNADPAFHLIFDIISLRVEKSQRIRLGALDVILKANDAIPKQQARVEMRFEPEMVEGLRRLKLTGFRIGHGGDIPNAGDLPKAEPQLSLVLPVVNIQPGGEDPLPTDDPHQPRLGPLVISERKTAAVTPLRLEMRQAALGGQRAALEMYLKLHERREANDRIPRSQRVFYLHDQPFTVAMLRLRPLATLPILRGVQIAYWSTLENHPGWQMAATADGFDLVWPSQGLLETMEKGRKEEGYDDFDSSLLGQARFAPASLVAVRSSDNERHFGLVPWNLRLFLNEVRDTPLAGLPVSAAQVEMLYGLEFKWSGIPHLRLAELFSRMGEPRYRIANAPQATDFDVAENGILKQQLYYPGVVASWEQRARQLQRRLAVYEVFDDRQPDFKVNGEPGGTMLHGTFADKSSLQASLSKDALDRMLKSFPPAAGEILNPAATRIAGGLAWAFESKTLFDALRNEPEGASSDDKKYSAVEAHMTQLFFSALGGWGQHQASFDEGRAIISARIDMGRLTELRVERLGRIACAWNRAKLVTVYRRTVAPSVQFAQQQDALYSRPVIRKVEEYIEFQEPHRLIPDPATAAVNPELAGCLKACVCHERVPVDSRWGEDVRSADGKRVIGWKVPLNRPGAGGQVYGKANVLVQFHADPKSGHGETAARVRCLEDVWFYTDVRPKTGADSDSWEPIYTVDYGAAHQRPAEPLPDSAEAGLAMAPAMLTQYADFTVRIEGMTRGANLVGHLRDLRTPEGDKPQLGALLHSIVWSRGSAELEVTEAPLRDYKAGMEDALQVLEQMATRISPRDEQGANPQRWEKVVQHLVSPSGAGQAGKGLFAKASTALEKMRNKLSGTAGQVRAETLKTLQANIRWTMDRAERQILGLHGTLQLEMREPQEKLRALLNAANVEKNQAVEAAKQVKAVWEKALADIDGTRAAFERAYTEAEKDAESLEDELDELLRKVESATNALDALKIWRETADHALHVAETKLGRATRLGWFRDLPVRASPAALVAQLRAMLLDIGTYKGNNNVAEIKEVAAFGLNGVKDEVFNLRVLMESLRREAGDLWKAVGERTRLEEYLRNAWEPLQDKIDVLAGSGAAALAELNKLWTKVRTLDAELPNLLVECRQQAERLSEDLVEGVSDVVLKPLEEVVREGEDMLRRVQDQLMAPLGRVEGQLAEAAAIFHDCREMLGEVISSVPSFGRDLLRSVSDAVVLKPSNALQLLRAAGDVPAVPMLDFKHITRFDELGGVDEDVRRLTHRIRNVGYSFDEVGRRVRMTPVKAVVDRAADALGKVTEEARLKASAIESTVNELRDRATTEINELKESLKAKGDAVKEQLGLNKLTDFAKDFAGLKLEKLLGAIPVSAELEQRIKKATRITQGADPKTLAAFIDTRVEELRLDRECSLFSFGPVAMTMRNAVLNSRLRVEGKAGGEVKRESWAQIRADWEMAIGGSPMVTYKDARLTCDNGRLRMELDPSKMVMSGLLQALTDLMKNVPSDDEGPFRFGVRPELPAGVNAWCRLDLPLPPLQGGTFGISGIKLGAAVDLGIRLNYMEMAKSYFTIGAALHLSEREAPFNITVFILGGCGWFALKATYKVPLGDAKPELQVYFGVSIGVSAALGINLGFASGSVFVALSLEAECTIASGRCHWRFSLALTMAGRLDILGIISVSLLIYLAIRYETGGGLEGVGFVSVKVKICWCFTLKVQRSFTYRFGKSKQATAALHRPAVPALPQRSSHLWPLGGSATRSAPYAYASARPSGSGRSSGDWTTAHANIV